MSSARLTEASYIVLGLLEQIEPATPYDLKQLAQISTVNFWTIPHTQIYTECARLTDAGLLDEEREHEGRRRRIYGLTAAGRDALARWRSEPPREGGSELRDPGTLKLFFGADPATLAPGQLDLHRRQLADYEQLRDSLEDSPQSWRTALELGIAQERTFIRFWSGLLADSGG